MKYRVEYTRTAAKQLKKLDRKLSAFILSYIDEKLVNCENPRLYGKALKGELREMGMLKNNLLYNSPEGLTSLVNPSGERPSNSLACPIWRYRVGDYRILARIDDDIVVITVVEVGHRKEIYD